MHPYFDSDLPPGVYHVTCKHFDSLEDAIHFMVHETNGGCSTASEELINIAKHALERFSLVRGYNGPGVTNIDVVAHALKWKKYVDDHPAIGFDSIVEGWSHERINQELY